MVDERTQYPDTLEWKTEGTPAGTDPETGFPVAGTPGQVLTAKSRYENFKGGSVKTWTTKTNETVIQKGFIYVEAGQVVPKKFDTVRVISPQFDVVFEGEILNVYQGRLNTTIAV